MAAKRYLYIFDLYQRPDARFPASYISPLQLIRYIPHS